MELRSYGEQLRAVMKLWSYGVMESGEQLRAVKELCGAERQ